MKVGVIGAGTMGQGIATAFAQRGWTVALCDIKQEWADNGKAKIQKGYAKLVEKGKMDQAKADACVIEKPAFPSLELGNWLREQGYDRVELVGLVSYICVLSNALIAKAALPEAEIIVDAACTTGSDPALHQKALDLMEALQITVTGR